MFGVGKVLDGVDGTAFFAPLAEGEAMPNSYEPFLEAFGPALRRQWGVSYTPREVVGYVVALVDKAPKEDLRIPEGPAAETSTSSTHVAAPAPTRRRCCDEFPIISRARASAPSPARG